MKLKILLIIILFFTFGCDKKSVEQLKYEESIKLLKEKALVDDNVPFKFELKLEDMTDEEVMYTVIIDKDEKEINNIEALLIHNKKVDDIYPSIGIFDDKVSLNSNDTIKGIALVGYIDKSLLSDIEFRLMISYEVDNDKEIKYLILPYDNL